MQLHPRPYFFHQAYGFVRKARMMVRQNARYDVVRPESSGSTKYTTVAMSLSDKVACWALSGILASFGVWLLYVYADLASTCDSRKPRTDLFDWVVA